MDAFLRKSRASARLCFLSYHLFVAEKISAEKTLNRELLSLSLS